MTYDFKNEIDVKKAESYLRHLIDKKAVAVVKRRGSRTFSQVAYFNALVGVLASEWGCTHDNAKEIVKRAIGFFRITTIQGLGECQVLRSFRDKDVTVAVAREYITRLREWANEELGVYLFDSMEFKERQNEIEIEQERQNEYLRRHE